MITLQLIHKKKNIRYKLITNYSTHFTILIKITQAFGFSYHEMPSQQPRLHSAQAAGNKTAPNR